MKVTDTYQELIESDLVEADGFVLQNADLIGYDKIAWHIWRFHRFDALEPLRQKLFDRFANGDALEWNALECLYYLQEQRRTGDVSGDRHLQCPEIFAQLCQGIVRAGRSVALQQNLVWCGLIEKENKLGLPAIGDADCLQTYGHLTHLEQLLMEAGRLNRCSHRPYAIYQGENSEVFATKDRSGAKLAEIYLGPYFFRDLSESQRKGARLHGNFRSPFVAGLNLLANYLLESGWGIVPLLSWRGGLAAPCQVGDMSFAYHTHGRVHGRWHYKFGHFSDVMQFDPHGYAGFSLFSDRNQGAVVEATKNFSDSEIETMLQPYRDRYIVGRFTWRKQQPPQDVRSLRGRNTFFLPLQDPLDEVSSLAFLSAEQLVSALQENLHADDRVLVKEHPLDATKRTKRVLSRIKSDPRFAIIDASIHDIFAACDGVITINSGVGFEALLYGLPVLAVGKSDYNLAATTAHSLDEFPSALSRFQKDVPVSWRNRVVFDYFENFVLDPRDGADFRRRLGRMLA